jgi:hypothetical protein
MKRYLLLGLATLGLFAFTTSESKADEGFRVYVDPGYQQYRPYCYCYGDDRYRYYRHADEYRWHQWQRWHRTIIGTITIGIMIETTTGIDGPRFSLGSKTSSVYFANHRSCCLARG